MTERISFTERISSTERITFNHHECLYKDLAMIFCGSRDAGKAYLLFRMLTIPKVLDFNNLLIYSGSTTEQFLFQFLKHGFENNLRKVAIAEAAITYMNDKRLHPKDIPGICEELAEKYPENKSNREIPITITISDNIDDFQVTKLDKNKKNLIVFDDCAGDSDQSTQIKFFRDGRHHSCACIYLLQRFHEEKLKLIRVQTKVFALFELPDRGLSQVIQDINIGMDKKELKNQRNLFGMILMNMDI